MAGPRERPAAGPLFVPVGTFVCTNAFVYVYSYLPTPDTARIDLFDPLHSEGPLSFSLARTNNSRRSAAQAHSASITCLHSTCRPSISLFHRGGRGGPGDR